MLCIVSTLVAVGGSHYSKSSISSIVMLYSCFACVELSFLLNDMSFMNLLSVDTHINILETVCSLSSSACMCTRDPKESTNGIMGDGDF